MSAKEFDPSLQGAQVLDCDDALAGFHERFYLPVCQGEEGVYLCGNSLGLQPKTARLLIEEEMQQWQQLGVRGHYEAKHPWYSYHETLTEQTARLVGAKPIEVVVMNSLTVNLHLMMMSFYRPTKTRYKILVEDGAFPSDQYAVASQARLHGFAPETTIVALKPRAGEDVLRTEDIEAAIRRHGESLALVLLGNVNFRTGQAFDMKTITRLGHEQGANVGFDLAHGAGNLTLNLHDDGPDFAVWCSYKYLNAGPGGIAGCFVHERHAENGDLQRLAGWWGHDKISRFQMKPVFSPIRGAEGWQLSNPPIFQMAALRASMQIFDDAGRERLAAKRDRLTAYFEFLLQSLPKSKAQMVTPTDPKQRGCQISLRLGSQAKQVVQDLEAQGYTSDFREPDILRTAAVPLYTRFVDLYRFVEALKRRVNA